MVLKGTAIQFLLIDFKYIYSVDFNRNTIRINLFDINLIVLPNNFDKIYVFIDNSVFYRSTTLLIPICQKYRKMGQKKSATNKDDNFKSFERSDKD
ncbi:hypothetical protein BpHYR1_028079 [Brachionus plicatilis]|uniref:Uncharacterized protein n=1 Tax=Brachionus plicatilis TaxID=10195 RepID=A0A3M7QNL4_BRAPC|nr:hypothetical protein BpHYR1_028079 [Brachionus plicatilis]